MTWKCQARNILEDVNQMHTFLSAIKASKKYFILSASRQVELQEAKKWKFFEGIHGFIYHKTNLHFLRVPSLSSVQDTI